MQREKKWTLTHGYAVLAIPETGLFVRDGQIKSGHGTTMAISELILYSRRVDADNHAAQNAKYWAQKEPAGSPWHFEVLPVLVEERL